MPEAQRGGGPVGPELAVPDNPPDQPVVRGGDPVVIIQVQLGQSADIDLEFPVFRHHLG